MSTCNIMNRNGGHPYNVVLCAVLDQTANKTDAYPVMTQVPQACGLGQNTRRILGIPIAASALHARGRRYYEVILTQIGRGASGEYARVQSCYLWAEYPRKWDLHFIEFAAQYQRG